MTHTMQGFLAFITIAGSLSAFGGTPIEVNLRSLREDAISSLQSTWPEFKPSGEAFYFQDGYSDGDSDHPYDHAAVIFASKATLPGAGTKDLRMARIYGLNGLAYSALVEMREHDGELYLNRITSDEWMATLKRDANPAEVLALIANLSVAAPKMEVTHLEYVGVLAVTKIPNIDTFLRVYQQLIDSSIVQEVEVSYEAYRIPFDFSSLRPMGAGLRSEMVTPDSLRTITKEMRDSGVVFQTISSFPQPFGPGWKDYFEGEKRSN